MMQFYDYLWSERVENSEGRWKDLFFFIKWSWFVGSQNELGRKVNDNIKRG
ncbi:hypothetical protein G9L34_001226 [Enterococcus hirae]|uniref:Uncharacterized protein n=1 Tax=Enterococcus hirae TaxID=1354 RepID=A0AB37IAK9_ENTHR|nr:hypothetical protein [Enterococcus hirae]EMF0243296.1 hypothetical protein [Enterococcus hirae]EMF0384395.1 hypothetical protein [Enterococcus hirae]EMF0426767.1 hypothetical protein [Enterococcus hirae]EMF0435783.1 hypothetical protein [Enterococcus hirae]EMF0485853.1 hypothetical protein [Enterococcus hirae]